MANSIYQYVLELNDRMSGTLNRVGVTASNTFTRISASNRGLSNSYNTLQNQIQIVENTMRSSQNPMRIAAARRELERLNREASQHPAHIDAMSSSYGKLGSLIGSLGIGAAVFGLGKKILTSGAEIESVKTSFEVLLGSAEKGNALIEKIRNYGNATPYESKDLNENAKMMLSFGISMEKILPTIGMLGDVAMGSQEKMNSLTLAFSQVQSAGKMQGQDLLQMINAGFNPLQEISKKTGKSMGELRKEMEKGQISFQMVEDAFRSATSAGGKFYQMAEKQSQTVNGKWSTLMDAINTKFMKLGEKLNPITSKIIDFFIKMVDGASKVYHWFNNLGPVAKTFAVALGVLAGVILAYNAYVAIAAMVTTAWTAVTGGLAIAFQMTGIPLIVASIVALIAVIGYVIYKTDGWGKTWTNTMEYMKLSFTQMGAWFSLQWLNVQNTFLSGFEVIQKGWYKLQSLWDKNASNAGLAKIQDDRNKRAEEILKQQNKVSELSKARSAMTVWEVKWNNKKMSDVVKDIKKDVGLETTKTNIGENPDVADKGSASKALKDTTKGITGGGTRATNINITLTNLVEKLYINSSNITEGVDELEVKVREALLRVLNSANGVAYGS